MDDVMNTPNDAENSEVLDENSEVDEQGTSEQDTGEREDETNPDETNNDDTQSNSDDDTHAEEGDEGSSDDTQLNSSDEVFLAMEDGEVINKADAENYAKVGYQFSKHTLPTIRKLEMIMANSQRADGTGYESLEEFADSLIEAIDDELLQRCRNDSGGNEDIAQELFKNRKAARDSRYEESRTERLEKEKQEEQKKVEAVALQFEELQKSFPEYKQYSDLPKEVKTLAAKTGISLLDAKLRYDFQNKKASDKAKEDMQKASNASAGSQKGQGEHEDAVIKAMLDAVNN